jgi:hypothetical protein
VGNVSNIVQIQKIKKNYKTPIFRDFVNIILDIIGWGMSDIQLIFVIYSPFWRRLK